MGGGLVTITDKLRPALDQGLTKDLHEEKMLLLQD